MSWIEAPAPARGGTADGYQRVARVFAEQLRRGEEVGGGLTVYRHGEKVVDLWGGVADPATLRPWERDTRVVVFSVTKGLMAMALHLLVDRGQLELDAPVSDYWPGFGRAGKEGLTVRELINHRAGLAALDTPLRLEQCIDPGPEVIDALEAQRPAWTPGEAQGYHATTFGLYTRELFERITGEDVGPFLRRELLEPLGSDAHVGTPPSEDDKIAALVPPRTPDRVLNMIGAVVLAPASTEARVFKASIARESLGRRALLNPTPGPAGVHAYNRAPARRAALAWASATASADGVARAYLPFANGGEHGGRRYVKESSITPVYARQGWSDEDLVVRKAMGWSEGFLKEEPHLFSPNVESFGHAGMGGALGWADPVDGLALGYVMNRLDWRVRSPRVLALCRALYGSPPLRDRARVPSSAR